VSEVLERGLSALTLNANGSPGVTLSRPDVVELARRLGDHSGRGAIGGEGDGTDDSI
jgi:hypothetical protein